MTDLTIEVVTKQRRPVKYLRAECGVRYWEDATVNGVEDADGKLIPCGSGERDDLGGGKWSPVIELATGKIEGWPQGTTADIHYKVCDDGLYQLLDADRNVVAEKDGYVINMMCPEGKGYGDYVIMKVGPDGVIANWEVDLREFESKEND
jgi:hypothetical protein